MAGQDPALQPLLHQACHALSIPAPLQVEVLNWCTQAPDSHSQVPLGIQLKLKRYLPNFTRQHVSQAVGLARCGEQQLLASLYVLAGSSIHQQYKYTSVDNPIPPSRAQLGNAVEHGLRQAAGALEANKQYTKHGREHTRRGRSIDVTSCGSTALEKPVSAGVRHQSRPAPQHQSGLSSGPTHPINHPSNTGPGGMQCEELVASLTAELAAAEARVAQLKAQLAELSCKRSTNTGKTI